MTLKTSPNCLILGAKSDIAQAIAGRFAEAGYSIYLAARQDRTKEEPHILTPLAKDLQIRFGVQTETFAFDAEDFDSHADFYNKLPIKPDVVISVFGYLGNQEKAAYHFDEARRIMDRNFTGQVSILHLIAADMEKKGKGCIIGISSVAGERGRQSNYMYGASKAAFTAFLSGLRNRLFHQGVHVLTVLPGFVDTQMTAHLNLPKPLTASPEQVAKSIYRAFTKKKNTLYTLGIWRFIMFVIRSIPEFIFKRLKL